jgi:hypothetical protein
VTPTLVLRYGVGSARRLIVATCLRTDRGEEVLSITTGDRDCELTDDVAEIVVGPVNLGPRAARVGSGEVLVTVAQRGRG